MEVDNGHFRSAQFQKHFWHEPRNLDVVSFYGVIQQAGFTPVPNFKQGRHFLKMRFEQNPGKDSIVKNLPRPEIRLSLDTVIKIQARGIQSRNKNLPLSCQLGHSTCGVTCLCIPGNPF